MIEHNIKNIDNTRIEFKTRSKSKIMDVFNYRCKSFYTLKKEELIVVNDIMSLSITDLMKWKDIDDGSDFVNVLKALKKITNPQDGTPMSIIDAKLVGYDKDRKQEFVFDDTFMDGKHVIVGQYADGTKMIYTDTLYIR